MPVSVHVVIAVEQDRLPSANRFHQARDRRPHALQQKRIEQIGERRPEKTFRCRRIGESARGKHTSRRHADSERLRKRERCAFVLRRDEPAG